MTSPPWPKSTYAQRPVHQRPVEAQLRELRCTSDSCSPIELQFAAALLEMITDPREFGPPAYINLFLPRPECALTEMPPVTVKMTEGAINILPEAVFGSYRCDFALMVKAYGSRRVMKACIECDGRDYHDRTDAQIAYDRCRDRFFQEKGFAVLRFPGFEITRAAAKCAREAINILMRKSQYRGAA